MEAGVSHHSTQESEFQVPELHGVFSDSLDYIARLSQKTKKQYNGASYYMK
jgi:hypothetical protein